MDITEIIKKIIGEKKVIEGEDTKDKFYYSKNKFANEEEAEKALLRSVQKLLDVNRWSELPGLTSNFRLHDAQGNEKASPKPEVNDYLRINLPGPLPENWVIVTDLKIAKDHAELTVSPAEKPDTESDVVEHFFIDEATSTFRVERIGNQLMACEIGRDEGINNEEKDAGERKLINTLMAEGGWAGFQELQWTKLTDYLVHKIEVD